MINIILHVAVFLVVVTTMIGFLGPIFGALVGTFMFALIIDMINKGELT